MIMHHPGKYLLIPAALAFLLQRLCVAQETKPALPPLITVPETHPSAATPTPKPQSVDKIVDSFFVLLGRGQVNQAYDQLTAGTTIAGKATDVDELKSKTMEAIKMFGAVQGYELVNTKNVGTHLMCSTYVSLGKNLPLRWKFYFYKSGEAWHLIDIRVDDRLVDMFDDKNPQPRPSPNAD